MGCVAAWDPLQTEENPQLEAEFSAAGERVFVRRRQKGHGNDGRALNLSVVSDYRLCDGRIVESTMHHFDTARWWSSSIARARPRRGPARTDPDDD
jgi:hypothetical protein